MNATAPKHIRESAVCAPAVSVLMAVYNGAPYLPSALDSVLAQSFTDFELVVVDDGSTDETAAILRVYAQRDPRFVLVRNERNLKLTASLNRGLAVCRAPLVARADGDDLFSPNWLETQVQFLQRFTDIDVVASASWQMDSSGRPTHLYIPLREHECIKFNLLWECPIIHSGVVFRRATVMAVGGYDERFPITQDYDLWARLAANHRFAISQETLVRWRVHEHSTTGKQPELQSRFVDAISRRQLEEYLGYALESGDARLLGTMLSAYDGIEAQRAPLALSLLDELLRVARGREKETTFRWAIGYATASLAWQSYALTYTAPRTSWQLLMKAIALRRWSVFHPSTFKQIARLLCSPLRKPKQ